MTVAAWKIADIFKHDKPNFNIDIDGITFSYLLLLLWSTKEDKGDVQLVSPSNFTSLSVSQVLKSNSPVQTEVT